MASLMKGHQSTRLSRDQPGQVDSPFCKQHKAIRAPDRLITGQQRAARGHEPWATMGSQGP